MYACLRRKVPLQFRQAANMVKVVVRDDDVLDIGRRTAYFFDGFQDASAGTCRACVNQRDFVIKNQVGLRASRANLEKAWHHFESGTKGCGFSFFPAALYFSPARLCFFPAILERGAWSA